MRNTMAPRGLRAAAAAFALIWIAGCGPEATNSASTYDPSADLPPSAPPIVADDSPIRSGDGSPVLPDRRMTPGAVLDVTPDDICVAGYTKLVRNVPSSLKAKVYDEYGITTHEPGEYEVDHLISLELGGSNSIKNLWPESYLTDPWNAHVKDQLENKLHQMVCNGEIDLSTAQKEIAIDWIGAYTRYMGPLPPRKSSRRSKSREQF